MIYEKLNINESKELALKDVKKSKKLKNETNKCDDRLRIALEKYEKLYEKDIQIGTQLNSEIIVCEEYNKLKAEVKYESDDQIYNSDEELEQIQ